MLLYELISGLRPFHALESPQGKNTLICKGERPSLSHGNVEPSFAGMVDLMMDCWSQSPSERPAAHEVKVTCSASIFVYWTRQINTCTHGKDLSVLIQVAEISFHKFHVMKNCFLQALSDINGN